MSEQQEKRREWVVGRRGSYTTGWPIYEDGALVNWLGSTPREDTAHQIVDDHNIRPELEWEKQHLLGVLEIVREEADKQRAELERTREALHDLVVASARWVARGTPLVGDVDPMALDEYQCCGFDYAGQHGVDCPYVATQNAIVQAKAILPRTAQQEESRDG